MSGWIEDLLKDRYVWMTTFLIFGLLRAFGQLEERTLRTDRRRWVRTVAALYRRVLPVLPEFIGTLAVLSGTIPQFDHDPFVVKISIGVFCGYLSQRIHKVIGQTILGDDRGAQLPTRVRVEADTEPTIIDSGSEEERDA
jgi:hypothetical protein